MNENIDLTKILEGTPKGKKLDPKTFRPFDKVLVRNVDDKHWRCDLFSHIDTHYSYSVLCIGFSWKYCIPYNDETKHLVGTTDDCPEYYKWWEE